MSGSSHVTVDLPQMAHPLDCTQGYCTGTILPWYRRWLHILDGISHWTSRHWQIFGSSSVMSLCLQVGMDMICAQGTEAGGHTGDVATLPLIPQCFMAALGSV